MGGLTAQLTDSSVLKTRAFVDATWVDAVAAEAMESGFISTRDQKNDEYLIRRDKRVNALHHDPAGMRSA
jgi:hypothetical protein